MADSKIKIVVLQRGWVYVGRYEENGEKGTLTDAKNVRRWGTTKGLGQLAADGPQPNTVLDPAGTVRFHVLTTVATLDADDEKWAEALA